MKIKLTDPTDIIIVDPKTIKHKYQGLPIEKASDKRYIKHVICEGSRIHALYYDNKGTHCSVKNCIINKK